MRILFLFLASFFINFICKTDTIFDEILDALNNKDKQNNVYLLQEKYANEYISGRGYLVKIEKDIFGNVLLELLNKKSYLEENLVNIKVWIKNKYNKEVLKYYKVGDYIYFCGKLIFISSINKEIVIKDADISKGRDLIVY